MLGKKNKLIVEKKDHGYYFPQFDIHVAADSEKKAKEIIKIGYNIDVDKAVKELPEPEKK